MILKVGLASLLLQDKMLRAAYFSQDVSYRKIQLGGPKNIVQHELIQKITSVIPYNHLQKSICNFVYFILLDGYC